MEARCDTSMFVIILVVHLEANAAGHRITLLILILTLAIFGLKKIFSLINLI